MKKVLLIWGLSVIAWSLQAQSVELVEYFFDDDPGYGAATPFSFTTAGLNVDESFTVSSSSLSLGFHTLYVRAQTVDGVWGIPEARLVFVDPSGIGVINVDNIEYFFDDDPGYGSATAFPAFTPATFVNEIATIPTSSLSNGFHTLYIRAQAAGGRWGIPEPRLVFVDPSGAGMVDVGSIEYFFDDDPGYGSGTAFTAFTASQVVNVMENIPTTSLSNGFHTLYIRAQAEGGNWGIPEPRLVFVDPSGAGIVNVDNIEYFFDDDPGYGSGTAFTAFTAQQVVSVVENIPTTALSNGFHTLFIRAQAEGGRWGIPEPRLVFVDPSGTGIVNVSNIEYFFDDDPGYGSGTAFTAFTAQDVVSVVENIPTTSLSNGFHTLFIRAQAEGGNWGIPEQRLVFVDPSGAGIVNVDNIEYFFDDDPGYGSGTAFTAFTAQEVVSVVENIPTTSLSNGFHTLYIRAQAEGGRWGIPEQRLVFVDPTGTGIVNVGAMEYFFDDDPGYGSGTPFTAFTAEEVVNVMENIPTGSLTPGFHTLYVRAQSEGGSWGLPVLRGVFVDPADVGVVKQIDRLEYFIDDDPGFGNGTQLPVTPDANVNEMFTILAASLPVGEHSLTIRARDETGAWGLGERRVFQNIPPSRLMDSLALVNLFDNTDGASWTASTNWQETSMDSWFGVTLTGGRVTGLNLPDNGLSGFVPRPLGYIEELTTMDLSSNNLTDTVPNTFQFLVDIQQLTLDDNALTHFPDVAADLVSLNTLNLDSNFLFFADLEPYVSVTDFTFGNQRVSSPDLDTLVNVGALFDQSFETFGVNDQYQWFLNGEALTGETDFTLQFPVFPQDTGVYFLEITNPLLPGLTLTTGDLRYQVPLLQADSILLIDLFNQNGGASWVNSTDWLTGNLANWFGITIGGERVTEVSLPDNGLSGSIQPSFNSISELEMIDVSGNDLEGIPDFSMLSNLISINVSNNRLDFEDLEPNSSLENITTYSPQAPISVDSQALIEIGGDTLFSVMENGASSEFQWSQDASPLAGETASTINILNAEFSDGGIYTVAVTNSLFPDLTLTSGNFELTVSSLVRDEMALLAVYNALDGDNWTNGANWPNENINDWIGITIANNSVVSLDIPNVNATGDLPSDINQVTRLQTIDVSGNNITSLPTIDALPELTAIDVSNNSLDFGDLEPNATLESIATYSPQAPLSENVDVFTETEVPTEFEVTENGTSSVYQWFFDNVAIDGATTNPFVISNTQLDDEGTYRVEATNSLFPDLTLVSGNFELIISSLVSDEMALLEIYNALDGDNWTNGADWPNQDINSWVGITITDNRVVDVNIPAVQAAGVLPEAINRITSLQTVDLSGNNITGIPQITNLPNLTSIDVSGNRLDFGDLEPNAAVSGLVYSPQQPFGLTQQDTIPRGSNLTLTSAVGGTRNEYQWSLAGPGFNGNIAGATNPDFTITDIAYESMGAYGLVVTNDSLPDLTLQRNTQTVLASVDIDVTPLFTFSNENRRLDEGEAFLIRVTQPGSPFDTTQIVSVSNQDILFEDVVLDDYLISIDVDSLITRPNGASTDSIRLLPTYFESTFLWEEADTLFLRDPVQDTIFMQQRPEDLVPDDGDGEVGILVESDFDEEGARNGEASRFEVRRRVRRAGCSLRRRRRAGGGRVEQDEFELVAYKETDDQGRVTFDNLPPDTYRLNIEFPGIPMDTSSFILFEVGANGMENNQLTLEATVDENGIFVEMVEALGILRKYFKGLTIYPNPVETDLTIQYEKLVSNDVSVQLLTMQGQLLQEQKVQRGLNRSTNVNVEDLESGIYLIRFIDSQANSPSIVTFRIIVTR